MVPDPVKLPAVTELQLTVSLSEDLVGPIQVRSPFVSLLLIVSLLLDNSPFKNETFIYLDHNSL